MVVKSCKLRGSKCNCGDSFRSKKLSLFMLGALRAIFAEIYKSGGRLWWKLLSESLPLPPAWIRCPASLPQGMMFCCHICSEGQVFWTVLVFLSSLRLVYASRMLVYETLPSLSPVNTILWLPWSLEQQWRRGTMTWAEFLWTVEICRWIKISMHLGRLIWARVNPKIIIKESLKKTSNKTNTKRCEASMI